ncbi:hypothetical protein V5799_011204 [Amblyomma americanum]|uniref:Uncharacterized protein n=1 Tax=Amblyomma americanum TaxID=6943 RepID=A0AAQ4EIJ9_AMBAM
MSSIGETIHFYRFPARPYNLERRKAWICAVRKHSWSVSLAQNGTRDLRIRAPPWARRKSEDLPGWIAVPLWRHML